MDKIARFTAEERDNLTAYLDGELDEKTAAQIEQKLAKSDVARRDVEILARTWDMLNLLPRTTVSGEFSRKTIAIATQEDVSFSDKTTQYLAIGLRIGRIGVWSAVLAFSAYVGFQLTHRWIPDESRELVEDLPVIENLDNLREIGDIEFLKQLKASNTFRKEAQHDGPTP